MSQTRSNGQGFSGGKGRRLNKTDSKIETFEFDIVASQTASEIDTGIKLTGNFVQVISAVVIAKTEESTGTIKAISIGLLDSADNAFITSAYVDMKGPSFTIPNFQPRPLSAGESISYTFGSADWVEFEGTVSLTLLTGN